MSIHLDVFDGEALVFGIGGLDLFGTGSVTVLFHIRPPPRPLRSPLVLSVLTPLVLCSLPSQSPLFFWSHC